MREDHLLARIQADRRLLDVAPELADHNPAMVAAALRANEMVIVCDHDAWAIESAVIRINLVPVNNLGFATPSAAGPGRPGP